MTDGHLLFITLPVLFLAAFALLKGIPKLASAMHVKAMADFPLASGGTVEVAEAGELILSLHGKLGGTDFATASFVLRDAAGTTVPSSMILVRSSRTGMDGRTTLAVRRFAVPAPGRYRLETTGIDVAKVSGDSRLVLTRPGGASLLGRILWVVAAAVALIASLVFSSIVAFAQRGPGISTPREGTPIHEGVMDQARLHLGLDTAGSSRFKVLHLRTYGEWTYFEGNEIVYVGDNEWQETDWTVRALLQFEGKALRARAIWSLPNNDRLSQQEFERQVADCRVRARLPDALFPAKPSPAVDPASAARAKAARAAPRRPEPTPAIKARSALLAAIEAGDLGAVQAAAAKGADPRAPGDFQRTPLHRANQHHLPALLRHGADLHRLDRQGNTALHIAAERDFGVPMCKALVAAGIAVNARNHAGLTPLHFAVLHGKENNLAALVELGADVNARTTAEYAYGDFEI